MCVCHREGEGERDLEMKSYRNHAPAPPAPCSVPSRPLCFNSFPLSKAYKRLNPHLPRPRPWKTLGCFCSRILFLIPLMSLQRSWAQPPCCPKGEPCSPAMPALATPIPFCSTPTVNSTEVPEVPGRRGGGIRSLCRCRHKGIRCMEGSLSLGGTAKEISKNHMSKYNCRRVRDMWVWRLRDVQKQR